MKRDHVAWQNAQMDKQEPRDRLREARTSLRQTRAQLAAKVGIASSTIAAHESGQNQIKPNIAARYARELGVTPSWLLYGDSTPHPASDPLAFQTIEVVDVIDDGGYEWRRQGDERLTAEPPLVMAIPEHASRKLSAYRVRDGAWGDMSRTYLITAEPWPDLRLLDAVILKETDGSFYRIRVWGVGGDRDHIIFYKGESQSAAQELIKIRKGAPTLPSLEILGVVVAEFGVKRPPDEHVSLEPLTGA